MARFAKGFLANIAVLVGIVVGGVIAAALGMMHFDKVAEAAWFAPILPFHFGTPIFEPVLIVTMTLVMIVVDDRIRPACSSRSATSPTSKIDRRALSAGLRMDGLGTVIGGIFNTFPYTSFSQNVGLVGVTGIRSRYVCVAGGAIMIVLGLDPQDGRAGRGPADRGARRRGPGDVRHGRGDRRPHPRRRSTSPATATTSSSSRSRSASG